MTTNRKDWPSGIWDDEPDHLEWIDEETGYRCVVHRNPFLGGLCGYVGIFPDHPLHYIQYNERRHVLSDVDMSKEPLGKRGVIEVVCLALDPEGKIPLSVYFNVHGSLTYSGPQAPGSSSCPTWWFGFDCSHSGDRVPGEHLYGWGGSVYRDIEYVKGECRSLARQLKGVTGD